MEISQSRPAEMYEVSESVRGAPDLEMNGVKVQVQHMNLLFHRALSRKCNASDHDRDIEMYFCGRIRFYLVFRLKPSVLFTL